MSHNRFESSKRRPNLEKINYCFDHVDGYEECIFNRYVSTMELKDYLDIEHDELMRRINLLLNKTLIHLDRNLALLSRIESDKNGNDVPVYWLETSFIPYLFCVMEGDQLWMLEDFFFDEMVPPTTVIEKKDKTDVFTVLNKSSNVGPKFWKEV